MSTILVVDDRAANRDLLVTLLSYGGHRLLQAADGAEALALARVERPDLIIADILMPTMDGYDLVRQLRAEPRLAETPVIFWTAHYHEREAKVLARGCGVSAVITKPSEPEVILHAVETALGVAPPSTALAHQEDEFNREHLRLLTDKLSQSVNKLRAANEQLSALIDLNLQLASELDLRRLIQSFGRAARQIIGARFSITAILDADGKRFQSLYTSGMDAETAARLGTQDPRAAPLRAPLREGRSIRLQNPGGDPCALGFPASHPPIHSWLGVPIASPTRLYGYIGLIDRIGGDEFSSEDERLATILAAQVGRIYQNGSLYSDALRHASELEREVSARAQTEKALAERVRQGALIGEVDAALTQSDTQSEMLERCVRALVRHLDATLARIWTLGDNGGVPELKASAGMDNGINRSDTNGPLRESAIGWIARERSPYLANDLLNDPNIGDKEWVKREFVVSFAGFPLVVENLPAGVVGVFAPQPLSTETTHVIGAVASKIALGIERFRANEVLREREEHIRLLLDSTAEAIYGIDLEGRCTFANSACARVLGYADTSTILGRNMHTLMHHSRADGSHYPEEECRIFRAFRQGHGIHVDDEVIWRADGSSFPAEYWSFPVQRDGLVTGSVVTFIDISERLELQAQFRRSEQRLRDIVVSSPAVLFTVEIKEGEMTGISWISDNLMEILGHHPAEAIGSEWWMANVHPEDRESAVGQAKLTRFSRDRSSQEFRLRHGDGTYHWIRSDMRLIRDETGKPSEVVGAWSDITELKRAEGEQMALRLQLEQTMKLESLGQLAGGVAHDFNNLLGVIVGFGELLQLDLKENPKQDKYIAGVLSAAQRAAELTRQLLAFSRQQVFQPGMMNLSALVGDFEKMLRRIVPENIEMRTVLRSKGHVRADPGQIEQVIMNLVVNARDAINGIGRLTIETDDVELDDGYARQHLEVSPGSYVMLAVVDTGQGMTPEVMTHIFEPFFTTKEKGKGTGLGLGMVHGIVKQSGGSVYVYSEPGLGTTFKIYLPRLQEAGEIAISRFSSGEMPRGTETILLTEDEEGLRGIVSEILSGLGYTVLDAEHGKQALRLSHAHNGPIHLLITDVIMPGMGGRELADRLVHSRPMLKVLYISGYTDDSVIAQGVFSNQMEFLQKPISRADLAQKVRDVLDTDPSGFHPNEGEYYANQ